MSGERIVFVALNAKFRHTNLAVRYLQRALQENGISSEILEHTINEPVREVLESVLTLQPTVVLFSCYLWNWETVEHLSKLLKAVEPSVKIVLGGPEVGHKGFCLPDWADAAVQGEGETTLPRLIFDGIPRKVIPQSCQWIDLDSVPFPYEDLSLVQNRILYYESSRGCPFSCAYCLSGQKEDVPRFRSLSLVFADLKRFLDNHVQQVKFVDRTFNTNAARTEEIWRFLSEHDNGVTNFQFEVGADLLTESQTALLKQMRPGLIQLEIGVQSVCEETLEKACRKTNLTVAEQRIKAVLQGGNVHCHVDLIAGLPGETFENTLEGCNRLLRWNVHQLQLGFLKVLAGAPLGEQAHRLGLIYDEKAPYEILKTPDITFFELRRLEGLAQAAEIYWNSGRFYESIRMVLGEERPGAALLQLWESLPKRPVGKYEYYDFLYAFAKETLLWTTEQLTRLAVKMRYDLCRHERPKKLPSCLPKGIFPKKAEIPEGFGSAVHWEWAASAAGERALMGFDYEHRDILGRAEVIQAEHLA